MMRFQLKFIPVALAVALLAGAAADMLRRPKPGDAEPFHARVRQAAAAIPNPLGDWHGEDHEIARSAVALLRPNVVIQRLYTRKLPDGSEQSFNFLLVQCEDARDMVGHNPPNCYPSQGWQLVESHDMDWTVPDPARGQRTIPGREYRFTINVDGYNHARWVAHLILLPDGRLVRNVDEINAAEADRSRRFFGAAQIQLVFDDSFTDDERRAVFAEVIGANLPLIDALCSGGK